MSVDAVMDQRTNVRDFEIPERSADLYPAEFESDISEELFTTADSLINQQLAHYRKTDSAYSLYDSVASIGYLARLYPDRKINLSFLNKRSLSKITQKNFKSFISCWDPIENFDLRFLSDVKLGVKEEKIPDLTEAKMKEIYESGMKQDRNFHRTFSLFAGTLVLMPEFKKIINYDDLWEKVKLEMEESKGKTDDKTVELFSYSLYNIKLLFPEKSLSELGITPEIWERALKELKELKALSLGDDLYQQSKNMHKYLGLLSAMRMLKATNIVVNKNGIRMSEERHELLAPSSLPETRRFS